MLRKRYNSWFMRLKVGERVGSYGSRDTHSAVYFRIMWGRRCFASWKKLRRYESRFSYFWRRRGTSVLFSRDTPVFSFVCWPLFSSGEKKNRPTVPVDRRCSQRRNNQKRILHLFLLVLRRGPTLLMKKTEAQLEIDRLRRNLPSHTHCHRYDSP